MNKTYYDIVNIKGRDYFFRAGNDSLLELYNILEKPETDKSIRNPDKVAEYVKEIREYFDHQRTGFDLDISFKGTPFQEKVWKSLLRIPYGETRSYADIALDIGHPNAARAVGTAVGKNPIMIVIPCHRIINKNGRLGGFGGGPDLKKELLGIEKR